MSLEYSESVKLLTEQHLGFLSLKGGCSYSSESTLVKMPHCWKSHVAAHMCLSWFACVLVSLSLDAISWPVLCDRGIYWLYSLVF